MCLQYMKLKTKNSSGLKYSYVPCGKCADCRKKMQQAWCFRMNSEFLYLKNQGWNIAFCTLTYDDSHLPHIPEECFKDSEYREISCFCKPDVRSWIDNIRHYCKRHYRLVNGDNVRYFIASEYGSQTHRPHYHAILAFPDRVSYEEMHGICAKYWTNGLMFPRHYLGDAENNCMSFEVVGDPCKVLSYVSKYVCKDLDYLDQIDGCDFYNYKDYEEGTNEYVYGKVYQDCQPFHIQSKSLGFEPYKLLTDEEKLNVYQNGKTFTADGQHYSIPIYIKNKLVYDLYYITDSDGKRLCRRKASEFFEKYRRTIFSRKAEYYYKYLKVTEDAGQLEQRGLSHELAVEFGYGISQLKDRAYNISGECQFMDEAQLDRLSGKLYLAYNNIDPSQCYQMDLCEQWMRRYRTDEVNFENSNYELADAYVLSYFRVYWNLVDLVNSYLGSINVIAREESEKLLKRIREFYSNL